MEFSKFKIEAHAHPNKTIIKVNGIEQNDLFGYSLQQDVDTVPELTLQYRILDIANIEGEGLIKYNFSLPDNKKVREALYEQLKEEFEN